MFAKLAKSLGVDADARVAESVLATLVQAKISRAGGDLDYGLDTHSRDDAFTIRIRHVTHFSDKEGHHVFAASQQVVDVNVLALQQKIYIVIRRTGTDPLKLPRVAYTPLAARDRRTRTGDPGWASVGITNGDDCAHLDAVIDDTNNMSACMPAMRSWLEMIDTRRTDGGVDRVHRPRPSDDASESEANVLERGDVPECGGFALCFANIPDFSATFFAYLRAQHGLFVTRACIWFSPGDDGPEPTLVVNVRRMSASSLSGDALNAAHRLRGDPLRNAKRARIK